MKTGTSEVLQLEFRAMHREDCYRCSLIASDTEFEDPMSPYEIKEYLRGATRYGFVATLNGTIVGFVLFTRLRKKDLLILDELVVARGYRRRGVGSLLVECTMKACNVSHAKVLVSELATNAHLFFRSQSFVASKVRKDYFGDHEDAYVFIRTCAGRA